MPCSEISAYDGGQEMTIRVGGVDGVAWKPINLQTGDTLSSASFALTGATISAVQTSIDTERVVYSITGLSVGDSIIDVSLTTALGLVSRHALTVRVLS